MGLFVNLCLRFGLCRAEHRDEAPSISLPHSAVNDCSSNKEQCPVSERERITSEGCRFSSPLVKSHQIQSMYPNIQKELVTRLGARQQREESELKVKMQIFVICNIQVIMVSHSLNLRWIWFYLGAPTGRPPQWVWIQYCTI